jgi:aryl-alcohol dehydrogenase-like predicted oxidoreductase
MPTSDSDCGGIIVGSIVASENAASQLEEARVEMRPLGASARTLSVLGYGAWVTGADTASSTLDLAAIESAIRTALDAGVTWIDTAEIYSAGASEEIVGRTIRSTRDDVFLVTKVAPSEAGSGMRPENLHRAVRASLGRLGTDRVDLYLLHWHDPTVPLEETWGTMISLVEEGLVGAVGVSNFNEDEIRRCLSVGRVDAVENQMSLLHRDDEDLAILLAAEGISFLAYGALAFGLLSGRIMIESPLDPADWRAGRFARYESNYYDELFAPGRIEHSQDFARGLAALACAVGVPAPVLALRWVLDRPGVTATIIGSLNPAHIRMNALAGTAQLDAETKGAINDLLEGHRRAMREVKPCRTPSTSTRD